MITFLIVGLPAIDEALKGLLQQLSNFDFGILINLTSLAKNIGLLFALCVGAYECWMMMLGRRAIDVMKLFRIVGLSMCISFSGAICSTLAYPGRYLELGTKHLVFRINQSVAKKELQAAKLQDKYYQKVRALQDSIETAKKIEAIGEDASWYKKIEYSITNLGTTLDSMTKRAAIVTETKITEWANLIIRFIGEAIFQIAYFSLLIMQLAFMKILAIFAPIMFAFSIAPPWSNAWSQWVSKYLSVSLWGFVTYFFVYYADAILLYTLEKDIIAYTALIGSKTIGSWDSIGTLGMQGIGSTCMYFVGMCIGAVLLKSVPEVCSWLIPGGVSSSTAGGGGGHTIGMARTTISMTDNAIRRGFKSGFHVRFKESKSKVKRVLPTREQDIVYSSYKDDFLKINQYLLDRFDYILRESKNKLSPQVTELSKELNLLNERIANIHLNDKLENAKREKEYIKTKKEMENLVSRTKYLALQAHMPY